MPPQPFGAVVWRLRVSVRRSLRDNLSEILGVRAHDPNLSRLALAMGNVSHLLERIFHEILAR